jgi:hypothetical protein
MCHAHTIITVRNCGVFRGEWAEMFFSRSFYFNAKESYDLIAEEVQKVLLLAPPSLSLASCSLDILDIDVTHSCHYSL